MAVRGGSDLDIQDEEELLLIVSGIGEHVVAEGRYMIGTDCKDCVSDLQRYLRRDDPMVMAAHRALGSWRTMQTHLLPLLTAIGDSDAKLTFNVLKVIVKLTMKPEQLGVPSLLLRATPARACTAQLASLARECRLTDPSRSRAFAATRMLENINEKKTPDPLFGARIDELQRYHRAYKRAFVRGETMGAIASLLGRSLGVPEDVRSDDESMTVELLLALVLNILHTAHPDAPPAEPERASEHLSERETLRALLCAMEREHVLETLLYVLQQVEESPTLRSFNLTLLEITYYTLSAHKPDELYAIQKAQPQAADTPAADRSAGARAANVEAETENGAENGAETGMETGADMGLETELEMGAETQGGAETEFADETAETEGGARARRDVTPPVGVAGHAARTGSGSRQASAKPKGVLGSLVAAHRHQRQNLLATRSSRHGNFGGAYTVNTVFGTQHVSHALNSSGDAELPQAAKKRTTKNRKPMSAPIELRRDAKSEGILRTFVDHLLQGPFNALMSTVVKDLEGYAFGSNAYNAGKVIAQDHMFFAASASWLLQAHVLQQQQLREEESTVTFEVGPVGVLADASVISMGVRLCREMHDKRNWLPLGVLAGLLRQLFSFLDEMARYGDVPTREAAQAIQKQVFYEMQILEMLKLLIESYEPFRMPPSFMADCAIMTHVVLRQLENYGGVMLRKKKKAAKKKKRGEAPALDADGLPLEGAETLDPADNAEDDPDEEADRIAMEEISLDFEHELYKFAGNRDVVTRYVGLLANFESVPPQAIHCALKLISRLVTQCKLEAMLFQLSVLHTLSGILDNPLAKQPQHADLYATCRYLTRRFFTLAQTNRALFVECLVWKPAKACEEVSKGYENRQAKKLPGNVVLPDVDDDFVYPEGYEGEGGLDVEGGLEGGEYEPAGDLGDGLGLNIDMADGGIMGGPSATQTDEREGGIDPMAGGAASAASSEGESLFAELLRVSDGKADKDSYYDEDGWDIEGLISDTRVYKKEAAAKAATAREATARAEAAREAAARAAAASTAPTPEEDEDESEPPSEPPSLPPSDDEAEVETARGSGELRTAVADDSAGEDQVAAKLAGVKAALDGVTSAGSKHAIEPTAPKPAAKRRQIIEDSDED